MQPDLGSKEAAVVRGATGLPSKTENVTESVLLLKPSVGTEGSGLQSKAQILIRGQPTPHEHRIEQAL